MVAEIPIYASPIYSNHRKPLLIALVFLPLELPSISEFGFKLASRMDYS